MIRIPNDWAAWCTGGVQGSTWSRRLSALIKRSFSLAGHRTSVALEDEFWAVLGAMAQARGQSLSALVAAADVARDPDRPLASALRVMALGGTSALREKADG